MTSDHLITVFEHETLKLGKDDKFTQDIHNSLQRHYGNGVPYYTLVHNGVKFNEYVGVIQVGKTVIEVLPKTDKITCSRAGESTKNQWRDVLIGMLKAAGTFPVQATSMSNLSLKPNHLLDLYFELFIQEVERLLHQGLIKQYRKTEGNRSTLKGALVFNKHIQQNVVHQERFYVRHSIYDATHQLHAILYKTICLLKRINTNNRLHSRIGALLLHFPEMKDIPVKETIFEKIHYHRKNQQYEPAITIARLLLLKYHPDLSQGGHSILALMFDMNKLWEKFVYVALRKHLGDGSIIKPQHRKAFWKTDEGNKSNIQPDIWIKMDGKHYILDTKWKNLNGKSPSPDDLRQLYVYHEYYEAEKVALVYPGSTENSVHGYYSTPGHQEKTLEPSEKKCKGCSMLFLEPKMEINLWMDEISAYIIKWGQIPTGPKPDCQR